MDAATFRQQFKEFSDITAYPDDEIDLHLAVGALSLDAGVWGDFHDRGLGLFIAHNLAIGAQDLATVAAGGVPGKVSGPQTSKSVDKVSASYDTGATTYEGAGYWNMTSYGVRLYQLARIVGAGGRQL
jgi:hypothetical protein